VTRLSGDFCRAGHGHRSLEAVVQVLDPAFHAELTEALAHTHLDVGEPRLARPTKGIANISDLGVVHEP
jgi:hypothetical protein